MQDLIHWNQFITDDPESNSQKFSQFIDIIKSIDDNTSPDLWVKWKNYSYQVVIETPKYFYKIYQEDPISGEFIVKIRNELAKIYAEQYNLHWKIITININGYIYQLEQREKLQVCSSDILSFDDLFLNWYKTLELLEKALFLDKITEQLKIKIPDLDRLKLIRDCSNKFPDYAIKDGHVILLDDADWFLCLTNKSGNWIKPLYNIYPIITLEGERVFAPLNVFEMNMIEIREAIDKWTIISDDTSILKKRYRDFYSARDKMLSENIQVLTTGKLLDNKALFVEKQEFNDLENTKKFLQISHQ